MSTPTLGASVLDDVQARIAAIQARVATLTGAATPTSTASTTATDPSTASTTFSGTLALAQAQLDGDSSSTGTATSGDTASAGDSGAASGSDIVDDAMQYLGTPYQWGGTSATTGFDCSGFVQHVLADQGITAPRTAAQQATMGTEVDSLADAQPGDLVILEGGHHVGIYVGDGKMINAPKTGDVVKVEKVWETPTTIRRVASAGASGSSSSLLSALSGLSSLSGLGGSTSSTSSTSATSAASALAAYLRSALLTGSTTSTTDSSDGTSGVAAYQSLFDAATTKYGLPSGLLAAVATAESGGDPDAVSSAGAQGLMQLMPGTAASLGVDATDPAQAVDGAARLLRTDLTRFGSVPLALAAYNAGAGNVAKYGGIPPFGETQAYVKKITDLMASTSTSTGSV